MNCSFDMLTTFSLGPLQYRWGVFFFPEIMTFISAAFSIDAVDFLLYIDCDFSLRRLRTPHDGPVDILALQMPQSI
jgi:hypothetical protein